MSRSDPAARPSPSSEMAALRRAYETEGLYRAGTICRTPQEGARDYADELLADKIETVMRHRQSGLLVDLCCGTGKHLFELCQKERRSSGLVGLGLDFSGPFIAAAKAAADEFDHRGLNFAVADASRLPLRECSVGTLYCLSALYQIPAITSVFSEVARVLKLGGRAILDLGNAHSLNAIVNRAYPELPPLTAIPVSRMRDLCVAHKLLILEHRSYQILPLWANRPVWLRPLLHPVWKRLMSSRVRGRMIDEWISSFWLFRPFAFRHLLVVERTNGS